MAHWTDEAYDSMTVEERLLRLERIAGIRPVDEFFEGTLVKVIETMRAEWPGITPSICRQALLKADGDYLCALEHLRKGV